MVRGVFLCFFLRLTHICSVDVCSANLFKLWCSRSIPDHVAAFFKLFVAFLNYSRSILELVSIPEYMLVVFECMLLS